MKGQYLGRILKGSVYKEDVVHKRWKDPVQCFQNNRAKGDHLL